MQRVVSRSSWLLAMLVLVSCVTVNIYFPAAAAAKAADSIIRDVWHKQDDSAARMPDKNDHACASFTAFDPRYVLLALLDGVSVAAHAQNIDFNITSPQIEQITSRMSGRFTRLMPLFNSGAIGLTNNGYLAIRDAGAAPMAQRAQINQLVNAENADRKALYQAIANANHQPDWFRKIQQTFADRWISQAEPGWWYQSGGRWVQK